MADKAISELVAAEQIKSTDMFVLEQDGTAKRLQGQTLLNWLTAAADGHGGISNIVKTGTDGLVDTYTITLADTTTKTFTVTNGNGLTEFEKLSTVDLVDTYRFIRSDGTYFTFAVSNGAKGDTGDASHVWIKYASQQPTVNSHSIGDNPDDWMGVYSGTAETAPTDWQAYSWYQIKGDKGDTGAPATVTGVTAEYIVSDSGTIVPSGSWSTTIPSVPQGKYLWTRSTTNFNTGNPAVSYSVSRMGIDGSGSVSSVNEKSPSDSGNVTLTADDIQASGNASVQDELNNAVKYNTPQSLTAEQQAQARDNINTPAPYEAGDNISITGRVITTKAFPCNPKLTDNWYFGNPVDQRNGYIQFGGTMMYKDAACTEQFGVSSGTTPVKVYATYARPIDNGTELALYIPLSSIVRGYTGTGYGIDRWKLDVGESVTIDNGGLTFTKANTYIGQYFDDFDKFIGRQLVGSVLMGDGNLYTGTYVYNGTLNQGQVLFANSRVGMYINKLSDTLTQVEINTVLENEKIRAAGLELGSQQTLAHKEYGEWVQNEIPKFGDQLAECQRYYRPLFKPGKDYSIVATANAENILEVDYALNPPMRTTPVLVGDTHGALRLVAYNMNDLSIAVAQPCDNVILSQTGCDSDRITLKVTPPTGFSLVGKYCFTVDTFAISTTLGLSADL